MEVGPHLIEYAIYHLLNSVLKRCSLFSYRTAERWWLRFINDTINSAKLTVLFILKLIALKRHRLGFPFQPIQVVNRLYSIVKKVQIELKIAIKFSHLKG